MWLYIIYINIMYNKNYKLCSLEPGMFSLKNLGGGKVQHWTILAIKLHLIKPLKKCALWENLPPPCIREQRTVAMETGCQNIQLCSTILKIAFPPAVIGPLFLFPMVYVFFQLTEALALIVLFRCHRRFTQKAKGEKGEWNNRCITENGGLSLHVDVRLYCTI